MPELPEVEIVRRGLEPAMNAGRIQSCEVFAPALRYPFDNNFAQILSGARVNSVSRRGKYLLVQMDNDYTLVWHLGMSGRVRIYDIKSRDDFERVKHDHVIMQMQNGSTVVFNDARRFGFMKLYKTCDVHISPHFQTMGPEPLGNSFHADALAKALANKKTAIKQALLDQRVVAGVGNIYACEALYIAAISPFKASSDLTTLELEALVMAIREVLNKAIQAGGSTLKDYQQTDGSLGYFQHMFGVYGRAGMPCPDCHCEIGVTGGVQRSVQGGRSTFYCPRLQK